MKDYTIIECTCCGVEFRKVFVHIDDDGVFTCPNCKTEIKIITEDKQKIMKIERIIVKENTWLSREPKYNLDFGWGNGYLVIPKGHKLHGLGYGEIHVLIPMLECNGGLTFSSLGVDCKNWAEITELDYDSWIIGFDTAHSWDTLDNMPMEKVKRLTIELMNQINEFKL